MGGIVTVCTSKQTAAATQNLLQQVTEEQIREAANGPYQVKEREIPTTRKLVRQATGLTLDGHFFTNGFENRDRIIPANGLLPSAERQGEKYHEGGIRAT